MDPPLFDPQVEALAPEYRGITWDERGFGDTTAGGPFSYWDSANDALGLLDDLGIDEAVMVGMTQGGSSLCGRRCWRRLGPARWC